MARLYFQYLAISNNEDLPNSLKITQSMLKIWQGLNKPSRNCQSVVVVAKVAKFLQIWSYWKSCKPFSEGKILNLLVKFCRPFGQLFIVVITGQNIKNNIAIRSHWFTTMFKIKILPLKFHQFEKDRKRLLVFKVFSFQKWRRKLQNFLRSLVHYLQSDQIWRFIQVFGNKLSHKSSPNILVTFWAISNNVTIVLKVCCYFLVNFWGKLGNILFHHLVTRIIFLSVNLFAFVYISLLIK